MKYISFEKSVGGVVYRIRDEKILYLLVRYRSWQWDFPKGHVEEGETEQQTLRREVQEETGLDDLEILPAFRMPVRYFYTAKGNEKKERIREGRGIYIFKKAVFYAVKTENENVIIDFENNDFAWLTFDQAYKRINIKNDGSKNVLRSADAIIKKRKNQQI
ncbi:MAG: NUDIX hydrolase [uncultured bacterium]|nr:MAG: NUDIX hydrolase [uncultured bacterium]